MGHDQRKKVPLPFHLLFCGISFCEGARMEPTKTPSKVKPLNASLMAEATQFRAEAPPFIPGAHGVPPEEGIVTPVPGCWETPTWSSPRAGRSPPVLSDVEFQHTKNIVPHMQHQAIVAVLLSLIEDYPSLAPTIRVRCEKAMTAVMSRPDNVGRSPVPLQSPWHVSDTTPPGSSKRSKPAHRHEEGHEVCSIHNVTRSLKHLIYNAATQQYECIQGYHCLVDQGTPQLLPHDKPLLSPERQDEAEVLRLESLLNDLRLSHPPSV